MFAPVFSDVGMRVGTDYQANIPEFDPGEFSGFVPEPRTVVASVPVQRRRVPLSVKRLEPSSRSDPVSRGSVLMALLKAEAGPRLPHAHRHMGTNG